VIVMPACTWLALAGMPIQQGECRIPGTPFFRSLNSPAAKFF
jgi:hypothetical protein